MNNEISVLSLQSMEELYETLVEMLEEDRKIQRGEVSGDCSSIGKDIYFPPGRFFVVVWMLNYST